MDWREGLPRWVQIADELERRIREGEYPPGSRVPSVLRLMEEFQVASATAQKALSGLRDRGLTRTEPGIGSTVRESPRHAP
ncbi:winged helix-turn-helix domain-containing protein [Nocardiopsis sp. RV163]|uniref:GntR family transcriptional regulator n=1 Tax=Nocardiopsis sp. RV163 TaxID=1661388 RepID=UPI00064C154F|nr:winged helix-turn-helix domain-containing protein [Nocardiopsis sp. RV163]